MILHYIRGKKTISDWFNKIFDKYIWLPVAVWFIMMVGGVFVCFIISQSFLLDDTKPEEVSKAYLYEIVVTKNSGLKTTISVESNDTVKVHNYPILDKIIISARGKNMYGIPTDDDIALENVKDYTIKHKKY